MYAHLEEDYSVYGRKRKAYKQLVQKKKKYERNARIGVSLDSMNNPKDVGEKFKKKNTKKKKKKIQAQDVY